MRIVISDASALIDLAKVRLLEALISLPYQFTIPDVIFEAELQNIAPYTGADLIALGFEVGALTGEQVARAITLNREHSVLSAPDCFAVILAQDTQDSILLTGDKNLRIRAQSRAIEVHGVIWAFDQMQEHRALDVQALYDALCALDADPLVRLPAAELALRLRRLKALVDGG